MGFDVHELEWLAFASKLKITGLFGLLRKNLFEKGAESRTQPGRNQPAKTLAHQTGTFDSNQCRASQVGLKNDPRRGEGEIAARRKIVKVGIIIQGHLQFIPGLPQFRVLHLQLNLMNLQFVEQAFGVGVRLWNHRLVLLVP